MKAASLSSSHAESHSLLEDAKPNHRLMRNTNLSLPQAISAAVRWGFAGLAWTDTTHFLKVKCIAIQLEENLAPSIYRSSKKKKSTHALKYESIKPCPSIFPRATKHFCVYFPFLKESMFLTASALAPEIMHVMLSGPQHPPPGPLKPPLSALPPRASPSLTKL